MQQAEIMSGRTILVVDDDDGYRWSLQCGLEQAGFHVVDADDGIGGLEILDSGQVPDLIITDMHMKRMNGLAFLKVIRQKPSFDSIPVLFCSGDPTFEDMPIDFPNVRFVGKNIANIISVVEAEWIQ